MQEFNFYREAKENYKYIVPSREDGLVLFTLYEKYENGIAEFTETDIIKAINEVYSDVKGLSEKRTEYERNSEIILKLQEFFLIRDESKKWYRGQGDSRHYLLPSLLRYENGIASEEMLFYKFRRVADKIFKNKSDWESLFDMQHYGIPTRLLDWSESFGIALYFAVHSRSASSVDSSIYLLDPIKLNQRSGKDSIIELPHQQDKLPYIVTYWTRTPFKASAPIAIEPTFINDRMIAQRGMFTVHDDDIAPIEDKFPEAIKKVKLPSNVISSAQEFLKLANINEYSVYPDLSGVAQFLRNSSGLIPRWK